MNLSPGILEFLGKILEFLCKILEFLGAFCVYRLGILEFPKPCVIPRLDRGISSQNRDPRVKLGDDIVEIPRRGRGMTKKVRSGDDTRLREF